ncbi:Hypothetical_protein [Hexamita inflata]|uniref:Hypothetical_protein n=1 Tax=Hexamita inflata TaxID=28002 RepID=A0AA86Q0X0_9EUKA|nr:Hypothetical protein HINF_LOCUS36748 [Hexamita inflata]
MSGNQYEVHARQNSVCSEISLVDGDNYYDNSFSQLFDLHSHRIMKQVSLKLLLTDQQSNLELLNQDVFYLINGTNKIFKTIQVLWTKQQQQAEEMVQLENSFDEEIKTEQKMIVGEPAVQ